MLEWVKTRDGYYIPKKNGKFLSSPRNPVKEAEQFVSANDKLIWGVETVFVLGLSSGHHVFEFAQKYPKTQFIVIDNEKEIIQKCENNLLSLTNVKAIHITNKSTLQDNEHICVALRSTYIVIKHVATFLSEPEFYTEIESLLLARDFLDIGFYTQQRPEQATILNKISKTEKSLNIHNILEVIPEKNLTPTEVLWRSLGELIK